MIHRNKIRYIRYVCINANDYCFTINCAAAKPHLYSSIGCDKLSVCMNKYVEATHCVCTPIISKPGEW